jgi:hypothetical protein
MFHAMNESAPMAMHASMGGGDASLHHMHIAADDIFSSPMNVVNIGIGKLHPPAPFAPMQSINQAAAFHDAPYLIYEYEPGSGLGPESFALNEPQLATSVSAWFPGILAGFHIDAAALGGTQPQVNVQHNLAFLLHASQSVSLGNTIARVGVMVHTGSEEVYQAPEMLANHFRAVGVDAELVEPFAPVASIYAQFIPSYNSTDVSAYPGQQPREASGGFAGAIVTIVPEQWFAYAQFDWVIVTKHRDVGGDYSDRTRTDMTRLGARWHATSNAYLFLEASVRRNLIAPDASPNVAPTELGLFSNMVVMGMNVGF